MAQQQEPGLGLRQLRDGIQERAGLVDALSHSLLFAKSNTNVKQVVGLIAIPGGKTPRSMAGSGPPHGISSLYLHPISNTAPCSVCFSFPLCADSQVWRLFG